MNRTLLFILALFFLLSSCQQAEFEFSCDPVINEFVTKNQAELSQIHVNELASYDLQLQKAIFNSWDYQKRRTAWVDKLNHALSDNNFAQVEAMHVRKLIDHIEVDYFLDINMQKNSKNMVQFAKEWINYAFNELGWTEQFIAFMIYRLYTEQSQFEAEQSMLKSIGIAANTNSESGSCDCNSFADFCGGLDCYSGACTITTGCGWLWSETCNGNCN